MIIKINGKKYSDYQEGITVQDLIEKFKDGKILPPTKPGLGIELNKDAIKKYQVG